jgi:CheY-like chemotaxis protein
MIILVADDYADTREVMRLLLEMEGHTVVQAANGRDAVEMATSTHPDLILMDLNMPVMDGFAAIRRLRADASTCGIRIVVLSANGNDPEWRRRATQCGCEGCFAKPIDIATLRKVIEQAAA